MNKKKKLFYLILILIIIIGLVTVFSFKTYNKYKIWNLHKDYFKEDKSKQKIEDWMSIRLIENKFNINLEEKLNLDLSFYEKRKSLGVVCIEKRLECKEIIKELNKK